MIDLTQGKSKSKSKSEGKMEMDDSDDDDNPMPPPPKPFRIKSRPPKTKKSQSAINKRKAERDYMIAQNVFRCNYQLNAAMDERNPRKIAHFAKSMYLYIS